MIEIIKVITGTSRLPFLLLVPACLIAGYAAVLYDGRGSAVTIPNIVAVFIAALCAHVSVNMFNEYFDFKSGLDFTTDKTPFSGGSGTLQKFPGLSSFVIIIAVISTSIVVFTGLFFVIIRGIEMIPFIIIGVLLVVLYTPVIVRFPILCFLSPGIGFGILMVNGAYTALTGSFSLTSFFISLVVSFLVSNLLLLNQFPDAENDSKVGRKTFPIKYGRKKSSTLFLLSLLSSGCTISVGIILKILPFSSIIAIVPILMGIRVGYEILKNPESKSRVISYLGMNVAVTISTPLILAGCLIFMS